MKPPACFQSVVVSGEPFQPTFCGGESLFASGLGKIHANGPHFRAHVIHALLLTPQRCAKVKCENTACLFTPMNLPLLLAPCMSPYAQVNLLCQAASLLVAVKTQQFKREIAAKKEGGKSKAKRGSKDKKASKQA